MTKVEEYLQIKLNSVNHLIAVESTGIVKQILPLNKIANFSLLDLLIIICIEYNNLPDTVSDTIFT